MRRMRAAWLTALLAVAAMGGGAAAAERCALGAGPASVYLVQDSGWMEPFYDDPRSPFRPLLDALVAATAPGSGTVVVASFDQDGQVPGRRSPEVRWCGADDPAAIRAAIAAIDLPRQPNGAFADADLDGALAGTVNRILDGHPGIVWLVTNNRNSRNNSQAVDDNTRAFANRLRNTAGLPAAVAFPLRIAVRGRDFGETGLIVYGIAYGADAAARLDAVVRSPPVRELFTDPAVRLKPLGETPLLFVPGPGSGTDGVSAATENGVLVVRGVPGGRASAVELRGGFRSEYYPQVIEHAAVRAEWRGGPDTAGTTVAAAVQPAELERLGPGGTLPGVRIRLSVPAVRRAGGLAGLLQDGTTLSGTLVIRLDDVQLGLDEGFERKMAQIAALDQLPGVFADYRGVTAAETVVPVRLEVRFSPWPLVAALLGLLLVLLGVGAILWLLRRGREFAVALDGEIRRLRLRFWERREVTAASGRRFAVRGALFGPAPVRALDPEPGTVKEGARTATRPLGRS